MNVTSSTKVHDLVTTYPYMLEWLVRRDAHFENLRNPVLFETMARFATLDKVADMAGLDAEQFLDEIRTEIARTEIVAQEQAGAEAPTAPVDVDAAAARQEMLKGIIRKLHDGASPDAVKAEFDELVKDVDSAEIARMEQALIAEGMPITDVQRLCDVHVSVFKTALEEKPSALVDVEHPLDVYQRENRVIAELSSELRAGVNALAAVPDTTARAEIISAISAGLEKLSEIATHFIRKENQLFPVLEAHDVSGPTKVMWAIDDDIRDRIKSARTLASLGDAVTLASALTDLLQMVDDMVYKEEKILFPTALQVITDEEWAAMAEGDAEIGYAWVEGPTGTAASPAQRSALQPPSVERSAAESTATRPSPSAAASDTGELLLPLPTGALTLAQLDVMLRVLPFDISYVDENDRVRFYSEGERVFPRSPGAIGREVRNCHPPKSVDKVEQILSEFKAGVKDVAEFWIQMGEKFIHIRYFAMRDAEGTYKGCLEVVQDATHVRALEGQRRIVDW